MKKDSKIVLILYILIAAMAVIGECYKEYIDLQAKVAIIKISNK